MPTSTLMIGDVVRVTRQGDTSLSPGMIFTIKCGHTLERIRYLMSEKMLGVARVLK